MITNSQNFNLEQNLISVSSGNVHIILEVSLDTIKDVYILLKCWINGTEIVAILLNFQIHVASNARIRKNKNINFVSI